MNPSFGMYLRAARLGYHWTPSHCCFIRMVPVATNRTRIDLAPIAGMRSEPVRKGDVHSVWWEGEDKGASLLDACPALKEYWGVGVTACETLYVDDDGRRVP